MAAKIVFWDWNGTLADEARLDWAVCRTMEEEIARRNGFSPDRAAALFRERLLDLEGTWLWHDYTAHGRAFGLDWKAIQERHLGLLSLVPGAREVLEKTRRLGFRNVLATNAVGDVIRLRLEAAGISDLIEAVIAADEAGSLKAKGRHFRIGIDRFGIRPEACFSVGDSPVQDIEPAARLGMRTILCEFGRLTHFHSAHTSNDRPSSMEADFRVRDLRDIPALLEG